LWCVILDCHRSTFSSNAWILAAFGELGNKETATAPFYRVVVVVIIAAAVAAATAVVVAVAVAVARGDSERRRGGKKRRCTEREESGTALTQFRT